MQDHVISVIIVTWRALQNHSSITELTWIFLHPTAPGYLLHRPCYHLVLFLSGIVLYRFWPEALFLSFLPKAYMFYDVLYKRLQGAVLSR